MKDENWDKISNEEVNLLLFIIFRFLFLIIFLYILG